MGKEEKEGGKEDVKGKSRAGDEGKAEPADAADESGVPWRNRAEEYKRKMEEAQARLQEQEDGKGEPAEAEQLPTTEEELRQFIADPKGYVAGVAAAMKTREELPLAIAWLEKQDGFGPEDKRRIMEIINENGIYHPSPLRRAEAAWKLLRDEKREAESAARASDKRREKETPRTEDAGKAAQKTAVPKRAEIIKQLAAAEKRGDWRESIRITDLLEDIRE